jgi:hypothetical protein
MEEFKKKELGMHDNFQAWRRKFPNGFVLNMHSLKIATLHKSECPIHFGDSSWTEGRKNWHSLGNKTKLCFLYLLEVVEYLAKNERLIVNECKSCKPGCL